MLSKEGFQPTETQPRGFNVDHSGKYILIAAGQKSASISVYEIVGERDSCRLKKAVMRSGRDQCGWWLTHTNR
ncbi:beta-propeller fold lactonase family protein [Escherichia coli]